jgi:hypothetical protein
MDFLAKKEFYLMTLMILIWFSFFTMYFKWGPTVILDKVGLILK